jgi:SOS-response transcriptional repressor LexA
VTSTQRKYYEAIRSFIETKGYCPPYTEIAKLVGVSSMASVCHVVRRLIAQGYLVRVRGVGYNNLQLVPEKINGMQNCAKGHPVIWYLSPACPLCDTLRRLMDKQHGLSGKQGASNG